MDSTITLKTRNKAIIDDCEAAALRFRPVTNSDIRLLTGYFFKYPSRSCDFSVGGVLMWTDYFEYEISETMDTLFLMGTNPANGEKIFYHPCGPIDYNVFLCLVNTYCRQNNFKYIILDPYESNGESCSDTDMKISVHIDEWKEYLYDIDRFVTFAGRKMEKKRNHLNFFINNYSPFTVSVINDSDIAELIAFTLAFSTVHSDNKLAVYECTQVIDVLRNYNDYPFFGIVIRVDNEIVGYSFGEKTGDTFFVHVEKGNIGFRGIYQALASRLAYEVSSRFKDVRYLNREEDMGDESLKRSKESYHPSLYINKVVQNRRFL